MSEQALKRHEIVTLIVAGSLRQKEGAVRLGLSDRHMKRIMSRYRQEGAAGLNSRRKGLPSGNRLSEALRAQVATLSAGTYQGFGPTLLTEKLAEKEGISLSIESVRQIMMAHGTWQAKDAKAAKNHPLRERRARFGELIQIDGSPHDWFEGRSAPCTLIVFIDDATGRLTQLRFVPTEGTLTYMHCLHDHIKTYGLPMALYSDKHSTFRINRAKEGEIQGTQGQTQWARAMNRLGIEHICANSPEAKGRVERANQTLQDRLIKEMRLLGINTPEEANEWLPQYIDTFNRKFAVTPRDAKDAHVAWIEEDESLCEILSKQEERRLSKTLTLSYHGRCLQITHTGSGRGLAHATVTVHEHFDGRLAIRRKGHLFSYQEIDKPKRQGAIKNAKEINVHLDALVKKREGHKPAANHPWRGARQDGVPLHPILSLI